MGILLDIAKRLHRDFHQSGASTSDFGAIGTGHGTSRSGRAFDLQPEERGMMHGGGIGQECSCPSLGHERRVGPVSQLARV
jgi:hypothetical protein